MTPHNILVDATEKCLLCNFGPFETQKSFNRPDYLRCGSRSASRWLAPECFGPTKQFTAKSDVWSLGVVIWQLQMGHATPYADVDDDADVMVGLALGSLDLRSSLLDSAPWLTLTALARQCLDRNPDRRPTAAQACARLRAAALAQAEREAQCAAAEKAHAASPSSQAPIPPCLPTESMAPASEKIAATASADSMNIPSALHVGDVVALHGLQARPELNSQAGTLLSFDASTARWQVSVFGLPEPVAIKPANLRPLDAVADPMISTAPEQIQRQTHWPQATAEHAESVHIACAAQDVAEKAERERVALAAQEAVEKAERARRERAVREIREAAESVERERINRQDSQPSQKSETEGRERVVRENREIEEEMGQQCPTRGTHGHAVQPPETARPQREPMVINKVTEQIRRAPHGRDHEQAVATPFSHAVTMLTITKEDGVAVVLSKMRGHVGSADLQSQGCYALATWASQGKHSVIVANGGVDDIVAAMTTHYQDAKVGARGCMALTYLAMHADHSETIGCADGVTAVLAVMRRHTQVENVQLWGTRALEQLLAVAANVEQFKHLGGVDVVQAAMNAHPGTDVDYYGNAVWKATGSCVIS